MSAEHAVTAPTARTAPTVPVPVVAQVAPAAPETPLRDPALPGLDLVLSARRLSAWIGAPSRVRYVRHKPGVQLLAWVEATASDGVPVSVLVQVASAGAQPKLEKLARAAVRAETWFVHDQELRVAAAGAQADRALPELRRVLPDAETLRYNPARRWVGRAESGGVRHLIKVFTRGGAQRSVQAATLLAAHGLLTPPVVHVDGDAVWWPWWEGSTLEDEPADTATLAQVGVLLARAHAIDAGQGAGSVWSHGDFSCDQVLRRADGALALLDLDRSGPAPRTADLSAWLGDVLARTAEQGGPTAVVAHAWERFRPLLEAYEETARVRVDRDELVAAAAGAVRERADEPVRRLDPDATRKRAARLAVADAVRGLSASAPPDAVTIAGQVYDVVRGWPRREDEALLELAPRGAGDSGRVHASLGASWHAGKITVQPQGMDTGLPALAERLAAGDRLVVHRPGRRAVLRGTAPDAPFVKVTRAGRASDAVARHRTVQHILAGTAHVPDVVWHTPDAFALAPVPGPTLLELGADPDCSGARLAEAWHALGTALARLHATETAPVLTAQHLPADEAATTRRWLEAAIRWRLLPAVEDSVLDAALAPLTSALPEPPRLVHRDLHEGQVLATDGGISLIDLDTAAWAEPAIDVANVLVHLGLRVRQGLLSESRRQAAQEAFLSGLTPAPSTLRRFDAYATAARLRLCGVYALRPRWRALAADLLVRAQPV